MTLLIIPRDVMVYLENHRVGKGDEILCEIQVALLMSAEIVRNHFEAGNALTNVRNSLSLVGIACSSDLDTALVHITEKKHVVYHTVVLVTLCCGTSAEIPFQPPFP